MDCLKNKYFSYHWTFIATSRKVESDLNITNLSGISSFDNEAYDNESSFVHPMSYQMVKNINAILKIRKESMILTSILEAAMICLTGSVMLDMETVELKMKYTV